MSRDLETQLRDYWETVYESLPELDPAEAQVRPLRTTPSAHKASTSVWRPAGIVGATAVLVLVIVGTAALILSSEPSGLSDSSPTVPSVAVSPETTTVPDEEEPPLAAGPLEEVQGIARSGALLFAWDSDGHIAGRFYPHWSDLPALPEPVVDVAEHNGTTWAVTTNRCDPSLPNWEGIGCESTLWRLVDGLWEQVPTLDGLHLPDDLEDIEIDSTGILWMVTSDGALYSWDGNEIEGMVETGRFPNDGIAIAGDGTIWASRFNPFFPENLGLARLDNEPGAFEPWHPLDGENHHAVITTTPDGDLWVWLSAFPSNSELFDGIVLSLYDSETQDWTVQTSDLPQGWVRAMAADGKAVWIVTSSFADGDGLWRFDGETWTILNTSPGAEILDVGVAPDGTVWYVEDHTLTSVEETGSFGNDEAGGS